VIPLAGAETLAIAIRKNRVEAGNHVFLPGVALVAKVVVSRYYPDIPMVSEPKKEPVHTEKLDV
jgi:hypothetical protein